MKTKTIAVVLSVIFAGACGDVVYYPAPDMGSDVGSDFGPDAVDPGCTRNDECGGYLCEIADGDRSGECLTTCTPYVDGGWGCATGYVCESASCVEP